MTTEITVPPPDYAIDNAHPAIQSALDAAGDRGGGAVVLEAGTYTLGLPNQVTPSLVIPSRTTLRGSGSATIVRRNHGGHSSPMIFNAGRPSAVGGDGQGDTGIVISDLALDGNKGDTAEFTSNEQGIWLSQCRDSIIDRVWAYDHRTNGIVLEYCQGGTVSGCFSHDNLKNGFYLSGSDHVSLTGCQGYRNGSTDTPTHVIGSSFAIACSWYCTLAGCSGRDDIGASLGAGRDTQYLSVLGGFFEGVDVSAEPVGVSPPGAAGRPPYEPGVTYGLSRSLLCGLVIRCPDRRRHGIRLLRGRGNVIADCLIDFVSLNGIQLHGSASNTVRGCCVSRVGMADDRSYQTGIYVVADSANPDATGNAIESNTIGDDGATPTMRFGIMVSPQGDGKVGGTILAATRSQPWRQSAYRVAQRAPLLRSTTSAQGLLGALAMALEDFLNQLADISAEAAPDSVPAQDAMGGADRTDPWLVVATGVSCMVRPMAAAKMAFASARDDARRNVVTARIYFASDPAPEGIGSRHRIAVDGTTYAVQGTINPNSLGRIFHVDCEAIVG